jgi:serine/threonine protein kinase
MAAPGDRGRALSPERWREVERLFGEALDRPAGERGAWIEGEAGDPDVRREVLSLLAAHEAGSGPLDHPCPAPPPRPEEPLRPGDRLGPYEILAPLGSGGMAYVFRAYDNRLGRHVALKILAPHLAGHPEALRRFEREARAVAALSHPNIVALHDVGREGGHAFAVMELLQGESLRERLDRGPLGIVEALRVGRDLARGLAAAHAADLVHRDLKPENAFLTAAGAAKVLDFGIARPAAGPTARLESPPPLVLEPGSDAGSGLVGTAGYISPEQARGKSADARSDVFSFGCVLYECLTGERAFEGTNLRGALVSVLRDQPPPVREARKDVPKALAAIVDRCLRKAPAERYASGAELAAALEPLAAEAEAAVHRRPDWRPPA